MAEDPKSEQPPQAEAPQTPPDTQAPAANPMAEPLPDGTVPTVLTPGQNHKSSPETKAEARRKSSLTSIYRRADMVTTLLTLLGAVVAGAIILAIYFYLTRTQSKPTPAPKVTTLTKADLEKLDAFFSGNSAGKPAEVLTISSSTLFNNRVAVASDLKVVGGLQVSGPMALGDLTVDKTSTLGVTNVRGQLTVAGPVNFQSPATLGAGATINGNLATSGNGSFGGSLSAGVLNARDISVSGTLNLAGHLAISGQSPSVAAGTEAGSGAGATIDGNDSSGTVTINTGTVGFQPQSVGGLLATVTFRAAYPRVPRVIISPIGQSAGSLDFYVIKTTTNFIIGTATDAKSNTSYSFDYWVVQ